MDRPLAIGGFSGVASTLILTLLKNAVKQQGIEVPSAPLPTPFDCECPLECPTLTIEDMPLWTFLSGLCIGALIGPAIDLLWLLRQRGRRFVLRACFQEQQVQRPLRKVLG